MSDQDKTATPMTQVVINVEFGGFELSDAAASELHELHHGRDISRIDPRLIALLKTKGSRYVSGSCARLAVVEFPEPWYEIQEYDGRETVRVFRGPIPESYEIDAWEPQ